MTIQLSDEVADAVLRIASKSGSKSVVEELLKAGVQASAFYGAAVVIAEHYGHTEIAELLRDAIARENKAKSERQAH